MGYEAVKRGSEIYPSHKRVYEAELDCVPTGKLEGIKATDYSVEVNFQQLCEHTTRHIMQMSDLSKVGQDETLSITFKIGFDGSTGMQTFLMLYDMVSNIC